METVRGPTPALQEQFTKALETHLTQGGEAALLSAYELGRTVLNERLGVLEGWGGADVGPWPRFVGCRGQGIFSRWLGSSVAACSGPCGEDRPRAWDAFEFVFPAWLVCDRGTDGEVADGGGDQDLVWLRGC